MDFSRRKQRGQSKKLKRLLRHIDNFRVEKTPYTPYVHFHVPSSAFIEHPRTKFCIKRKFCQKWIESAKEIQNSYAHQVSFCKVVAILSIPNLWDSQIIVFTDQKYYHSFWDRDSESEIWHKITEDVRHPYLEGLQNVTYIHRRIYEDGEIIFQNFLCCYEADL